MIFGSVERWHFKSVNFVADTCEINDSNMSYNFLIGCYSSIMANSAFSDLWKNCFAEFQGRRLPFENNWGILFWPSSRADVLLHLCMMVATWWLAMLGRSLRWWMWQDFWCCWVEYRGQHRSGEFCWQLSTIASDSMAQVPEMLYHRNSVFHWQLEASATGTAGQILNGDMWQWL